MRVLLAFLSGPSSGRFNPIFSVAQWLKQDGCELGTIALPWPLSRSECADQLASLGAYAMPTPPFAGLLPNDSSRLVTNPDSIWQFIKVARFDAVESQVEPVRELLRGFHPDAAAIDSADYA